MNNSTNIDFLIEKIIAFRNERDWEQFHNLKDLAIGLNIESSELLELFLWKTKEEINNCLSDEAYLKRVKEEFADIFIFCLLIKEKLNIDVEEAVLEKLQMNAAKYPVETSKGLATKYKDL
jgi:NTP pyrophosphatase (non-canonical NTP hydrolase)